MIRINMDNADLLKLNIGGTSFLLKLSTIRSAKIGRLYQLCQLNCDDRKQMADAYLIETDELFFQRSPLLFHFIYQYYLNGIIITIEIQF